MVFRVPEVARGHRPELAGNLDVDAGRLLEAAALHQPHRGIDDGFRGQPVDRSRFEAENIARQMEGADLAASVGQQLVAANRARDHLVDVFRRLILAVDFLVLPVGKFGRNQTRMPGDCAELVGRGGGVGDGADLVADNRGIERLGEHLPSPVQRMANGYRGFSGLKISRDILR